MTTHPLLKWPNELAFQCAFYDRSIPFRIRAGVINAYRRVIRNGQDSQASEDNSEESNTSESKSEKKGLLKENKVLRSRKRNRKPKRIILPRIAANQGSKHNFVKVSSLKLVIRKTSRGKGRPSRKLKDHFTTICRVIHTIGNKYIGGFQWPT